MKSIFDVDQVYFPINLHNLHWTLGCIDVESKCIVHFDSKGNTDANLENNMMQYIKDEWNDKVDKFKGNNNSNDNNESNLNETLWKFISHGKDVPQQKNSYDCGIFMLTFADWTSNQLVLDFTQDDCLYFRTRKALEILNNKLFDYEMRHLS